MVSKAPRSWLSSPLGVNILLKLCGNRGPVIDKYTQVYSKVKSNKAINIKNKILVPKGCTENVQKYPDIDVREVDFNKNSDIRDIIISWAKPNDGFTQCIEKNVTKETKSIYLNISAVEGKWKIPIGDRAPTMKVYNSFNYTQDVKYEARLLVLPLKAGDLKLVIAVPNEQDSWCSLVGTLADEGLEAAVHSIQPLFTASSALVASRIQFHSELTNTIDMSKATIQYGSIDVNENGLSARVLTCLFTHNEVNSSHFKEEQTLPPSFFFAITFEGTPIFTGDFTPQ